MVETYNVIVMGRSPKNSDKYYYGFMKVYRNMKTREIKRIVGINKFYDGITRKEMFAEYYARLSNSSNIDKVITNVEDLHRDFIYYPILGMKNEHEICRRYIDNFSNIDYPKARLQNTKDKNGIWKDDSKDTIKYRFSEETCKMITYSIAFAIDVVVRDEFKEMMKALEV